MSGERHPLVQRVVAAHAAEEANPCDGDLQ